MFSSSSDIQQKLGGTVILYDDKPVYVLDASNQLLGVKACAPSKMPEEARHISITDPKLDYRSISTRLGYMNLTEPACMIVQCIWLSRYACRKPIQGLSQYNMSVPPVAAVPRLSTLSKSIHWIDLIQLRTFEDMICNKYPTLERVKTLFMENDKSVASIAFHRYWAISRHNIGPYMLDYKGKSIGWSDNLDRFHIDKIFEHFRETAEYYGIAVA